MDLRTTKRVGDLYRAISEIAHATSPDLTLRQLLVLLSVGSRTAPLNQQQLSDEHELLKSTISKIVGNLAGNTGDVRRESGMGMLSVTLDPHDLRNRLVALSKQGEKVLTRAVDALS